MTGKGNDNVGSTFITHTGHLLYRQSQCRETNAKINFYFRVLGQLLKTPLSHSTEDVLAPSAEPHLISRSHWASPSDAQSVTTYHSSAKTHWLLPHPLASSDCNIHGISLSKKCSPRVCEGKKAAMCPWNQKHCPFQFLIQLVQQKTSMCLPVFCKPQGAASQPAGLVKLMTD